MTRIPVILLAGLVCSAPVLCVASPVTLRFHGTADLTAFGGAAASLFQGDITWDPTVEPDAFFPSEPLARYLIDGSPRSVRAAFSIAGTEYGGRIEPFSRFEVGGRDLFLQLLFAPVIDLDGPAPDIGGVWLELWSDGPVFQEVFPLPSNLSLLGSLEHRRFGFSEDGFFTDVVLADTLVVPEPSVPALLLVGFVAAAARSTRPSTLRVNFWLRTTISKQRGDP
jgi:hypothetical protein